MGLKYFIAGFAYLAVFSFMIAFAISVIEYDPLGKSAKEFTRETSSYIFGTVEERDGELFVIDNDKDSQAFKLIRTTSTYPLPGNTISAYLLPDQVTAIPDSQIPHRPTSQKDLIIWGIALVFSALLTSFYPPAANVNIYKNV